jgi:hypothetical protein
MKIGKTMNLSVVAYDYETRQKQYKKGRIMEEG